MYRVYVLGCISSISECSCVDLLKLTENIYTCVFVWIIIYVTAKYWIIHASNNDILIVMQSFAFGIW